MGTESLIFQMKLDTLTISFDNEMKYLKETLIVAGNAKTPKSRCFSKIEQGQVMLWSG
jgi:hypothetical protein